MRNADYAIACAVLAVVIGCALALVAQPQQATAREDWEWKTDPRDVTNTRVLDDMQRERMKAWLDEGLGQMRAAVEELEAQRIAEEEAAAQAYYEPTYYAPSYSYGGVKGDPDGLNSFVGVVEGPNGTTETAYSSNVLYHYRTSEWTPDEHGFYRTDEGYYVVASNDHEQGTVIETSRGEAMVLDSGCNSGWVDFYTNW